MDDFVREAELLMRGVNSADVVLGIFDHNTYNPVADSAGGHDPYVDAAVSHRRTAALRAAP